MARTNPERGDFGLPSRIVESEQVVGIFDLVDYTGLDSNRDLVQAVKFMELELQMNLSDEFFWDERAMGGKEKETNNILLRSTGDGYVVAFSQSINDRTALDNLTKIHSRIKSKHPIRLGINKGTNYIVGDVNIRVNILGWGINLAARALVFAESGQIICTGFFAKPLLETDKILKETMQSLGKQRVKKDTVELYNYYKKGEFGTAITASQRKQAK